MAALANLVQGLGEAGLRSSLWAIGRPVAMTYGRCGREEGCILRPYLAMWWASRPPWLSFVRVLMRNPKRI